MAVINTAMFFTAWRFPLKRCRSFANCATTGIAKTLLECFRPPDQRVLVDHQRTAPATPQKSQHQARVVALARGLKAVMNSLAQKSDQINNATPRSLT
jgi:hypothetical protein